MGQGEHGLTTPVADSMQRFPVPGGRMPTMVRAFVLPMDSPGLSPRRMDWAKWLPARLDVEIGAGQRGVRPESSATSTSQPIAGPPLPPRPYSTQTGAIRQGPLPKVAEFLARYSRLTGVRRRPTRGAGAFRRHPRKSSAINRPVCFDQIHSFLTGGKPYRCSRCNFCCNKFRAREYCDLDVPSAMPSSSPISGWL